LTDFPTIFLSASASCYFSNLLWLYIFIYILWGPKNGLQHSPVLSFLVRFPPSQFGFTGGSFRFWFSFPLFTSPFLFFLSPLSRVLVGSLFIGPRERGLFIAVHGERGSAGLAGQWAWLARCGAPDFSSSRLGVSRLLQGTRITGINEERGRELSTFPCCTFGGKEKEEQCTLFWPFFFT